MILYHGTSINNAKRIMKEGFKSREICNKSNWKGKYLSQKDFIYLTVCYPFFYGANAGEEENDRAVVIKVEVDEEDLYPDEDFIRQASDAPEKEVYIRNYKYLGKESLKYLGNVAVKANKIKILDSKEFDITEMVLWCDPSMSIMNFKILGKYYTELVANWYADRKWKIPVDYANLEI